MDFDEIWNADAKHIKPTWNNMHSGLSDFWYNQVLKITLKLKEHENRSCPKALCRKPQAPVVVT